MGCGPLREPKNRSIYPSVGIIHVIRDTMKNITALLNQICRKRYHAKTTQRSNDDMLGRPSLDKNTEMACQ